ncbi:MAG: hypothetical protein IPK70_08060 [Flavobacteriales bacterium]|jgi:predicted phage tail protein|nr:hypothetical protein [Flavobacteriales bacterium]
MPTDIDRYIRDGLELKKHGRTGAQVREWLAAEGLGPDQMAFILQQIGKAELKVHAQKDPGSYSYLKGFIGALLIAAGAWSTFILWKNGAMLSMAGAVPIMLMVGGAMMLGSRK